MLSSEKKLFRRIKKATKKQIQEFNEYLNSNFNIINDKKSNSTGFQDFGLMLRESGYTDLRCVKLAWMLIHTYFRQLKDFLKPFRGQTIFLQNLADLSMEIDSSNFDIGNMFAFKIESSLSIDNKFFIDHVKNHNNGVLNFAEGRSPTRIYF